MVHVIDRDNKHLYGDELEQHYRLRHRIYVDERRWEQLRRPDGREVDQFDTEEAVYLLDLDHGRVIGGTRLVPTLKPHLMADVFPFLANVEGIQRGADIVEWTRIFVVPDRRGPGSKTLHTVLAAMLEYCLRQDYRAITVVMETWWLPRFLELGWEVRPLGLPADIDGMNCVGTMISVTEEAWRRTLAFKGIQSPVIEVPKAPIVPTRRRLYA
ncbi:acyl-homoserine-lactone synthase [Bosea sp. TND4EK4]|uniref:acyl-homoserine-lactone synthase n=1 Tax=Bosea sp. TND4EK4 TaxID=1907408 RepID=UPI000957095D|nr:acyl-homoserine-lactone synthase [Bosea sp. TND4EK4]SIQ75625.1 acyl-homoserine lactone synthase [Bosea sp. TND4EK4]